TDGERTRDGLAAEEPSHQVVAAPVLRLVLVDHEPCEDTLRSEDLVARREAADDRAEDVERTATGELLDEIPVRRRDDEIRPDRSTPLRDERQRGGAGDDRADGPAAVDPTAADECLEPRLPAA